MTTPRFQRYMVVERMAVGGMAEVYRAHGIAADGSSTPVVLKRILPHYSENEDFRRMFLDEALITAVIHHPNVVQLYDCGRLDDQLFMALELVEGVDLERLMRRARERGVLLPMADCLFVAREILKGLQNAHTRKRPGGEPLRIVHRDVSAANVLISWGGAVKITDFGIAKAAVRDGQTRAGVVKGNIRYMSPEQLTGGTVDQRTDLYATALVLHYLVGGRHPYEGLTLSQVLDHALKSDLPPVERAGEMVPAAVVDAVVRATRSDPALRFADAESFLRALEAAGPPGDHASLAASVRAIFPSEAPQVMSAEPESLSAFQRKLHALTVERVSESDGDVVAFQTVSISIPIADSGPDDIPTNKSSGAPIPQIDDEDPLMTTRKSAPDAAPESDPIAAAPPDRDTEPSHRFAALGRGERELSEHDFQPRDYSRSVSGSMNSISEEITTAKSSPVPPLPPGAVPRAPLDAWSTLSPERLRKAPKAVEIRPVALLSGHRDLVSSVAFTATRVVSASHDQTLRVWDVARRKELAVLTGHRAAVTSVAVSRNGMTAVSGSRDKSVRRWDLRDFREVARLDGHAEWIFAVAISGDGATALSAGFDRVVRRWDLATGALRATCEGHRDVVSCVAFLPNGARAISGSYDRTLRVWDLDEVRELKCIEIPDQGVRALAVSPDGERVVTAGADNLVRCWELFASVERAALYGHLEPVVALAFAPDGQHVASGSYDGTVRVWDVRKGWEVACLRGHDAAVMSVAFSSHGGRLVSGGADRRVAFWDLAPVGIR